MHELYATRPEPPVGLGSGPVARKAYSRVQPRYSTIGGHTGSAVEIHESYLDHIDRTWEVQQLYVFREANKCIISTNHGPDLPGVQ